MNNKLFIPIVIALILLLPFVLAQEANAPTTLEEAGIVPIPEEAASQPPVSQPGVLEGSNAPVTAPAAAPAQAAPKQTAAAPALFNPPATTKSSEPTVLTPLTNALNTFARFIFIDARETLGDEIFLRVLIWIVLFTVFYAVLMFLPTPFKKKNFALPISAVMALISVIFMPLAFVYSIAFAYGFTTSFLLMAIPVVAVLLLMHYALPTTETKEPDAGKRRINHGIKAIMFYFLATLVQNFMQVQTLYIEGQNLPIASIAFSQQGWTDMNSLVVSVCMFLFLFHLVMAIFSGKGGAAEGEEGMFEKMFGRKEAAPPVTLPGERPKEEEKGINFGPIDGLIGQLNGAAEDFFNNAQALQPLKPGDSTEKKDAFRNLMNDLRKKSEHIENLLGYIASDGTFQKLTGDRIGLLGRIIDKYRRASGMIIDVVRDSE